MSLIRVEDMDISELDIYVGNKEVALLRAFEPEPGIFIAESIHVIDIALRCGYSPISAIILEKSIDQEIIERLGDIPIYIVDEEDVKKHFGYVLTGGISAAFRRKDSSDYRHILETSHRILVLEDVENPTNVGAIFRSAAALGIDGIILSPACVDPLYRRAMRVSVGNSLLIPWSYMLKREADFKSQAIDILRDYGFTTVAMALRDDNILIDDETIKAHDKLALIMGNEGHGLCNDTIQACDYVAKIPMAEGVDSLNVSVAAAIAMWEIRK